MNIFDTYDGWTNDETRRIAGFLDEVLYAGCPYTTTGQFKGLVDEWLEHAVRRIDPELYRVLRVDCEDCDWEQILERFSDAGSGEVA